jgi:hypothetical protein
MSHLDSLLSDFARFDETAARRLAERREDLADRLAERERYLSTRVEYTDEALDDLTAPDGGHYRGGYRARIVCRGPRGRRYRDSLTPKWRTPEQAAADGARLASRLAGVSIMSVTVERVPR